MNVPGLEDLRAGLAEAGDAVGTVDAVYTFLLGLGLSRSELRPLFRLEAALQDHARGKPHPLLAVKPHGGNRAHTADDMFKACVVATMAALMKSETKASASATISDRLKAASIDVEAKTIRTWYKEITTGRHPDDGVVESYRVMRRRFLAEPDHKLAAESLLLTLPTLMREKV